MLPSDASARERMLWAALAAIVGIVLDGPEATDRRRFQRIEAACHTLGVSAEDFDAVAERLNFHYFRPGDCYLGHDQLADAMLSASLFHYALPAVAPRKKPASCGPFL